MTINISTFIKDIINSKDICAKFGADVILDFIDITSNVQWSYHNYTKLNKTLVNSGKFSQSFIQTINDEYYGIVQTKTNKINNNNGLAYYLAFHTKKANEISIQDYSKTIELYHYGTIVSTINLQEDIGFSDNFSISDVFCLKWSKLSVEEQQKWIPSRKVNCYTRWISIYSDMIKVYYECFLNTKLEGIELYKKMGKIWTEIKHELNKDEFNDYTQDVPGLKISDSYKRHARVKNELLLIRYINKFIINNTTYNVISLDSCKKFTKYL
jgi:hypothetical protein